MEKGAKKRLLECDFVEQWDPDLLAMVTNRTLNMALAAFPLRYDTKGLNIFPIIDEYVCAVVSSRHPLAQKKSLSLDDLKNEKIVTTSPHSGLHRLMMEEFAASGITAPVTMNIIAVDGRMSMVSGGAVTFVMHRQFKYYENDSVCVIPIEPKIYRTLAVVTPSDRALSVEEKVLINLVRQTVSKRLES